MKKLLIVLLSVVPLTEIFSQEGLGLNPPGLKWRQIQTTSGRIIFPRGMDSLAFRTAALVNYQRHHDSALIGAQTTQRVPQIIQNQSVLPAGFSTPAPWRSEYYVTPPANMFLGPVSWADAMEVHEYRHAQQFSKANQGLTWPYKILLGQTGWLLNSLITQPLWFREGDAVLAETALTHGGRGRLPSFHMEYRAMRMKGYYYNYEKAHFPSLRNFVPNPYRIGYYMVTKARRDFGNDVWRRVLENTYRKKGFIYPFSRSLKEYTGLGTKELYNRTVKELDSVWSAHDVIREAVSSRAVSSVQPKKYTSYRLPQFIKGDSLVVVKSSLDMISTFYLLTADGEEKQLFSPGRYTDDHATLVAENGKMVWAESGFHERYLNKDYSVIKIYDVKSGQVRKLTSRTRYFSPSISPDKKKIFVTETDYQNKYFFLLLDATTGKVLRRWVNPKGIFLSHPRWMEDNVHVICIALSEKGNAIVKLNTETAAMEELLPPSYIPLSRPFPKNKHVFFSAGHNGTNNLCALDMDTRNIYQVTDVRFGAFEPVVSADGKRLVFSEYTADGYRLQQIDVVPERWKPIPGEQANHVDFLLNNVPTSEERVITDSVYSNPYEVRKFNTLTNGLFNFYGWLVLPNIPEYGIEFYTQNIMSTLRGTVGVLYNTNEDRFHYYARATYAAFYPVIELEYNNGSRHSDLITTEDPSLEPFRQTWREEIISGGIRIPLRLTQGTHNTNLSMEGHYERFKVYTLDTADTKNVLDDQEFNAVRTKFTFSRLKLQAQQNFRPRWGQVLDVEYRDAFDATANRFHANTHFYFPGLFNTHSFNVRGSYKQEAVVDAYRFTDNFIMPRGYEPFPFEEITLGSVNYEFPILYPDLALTSVAFIQRVRTNVFYDHAVGNLNGREFTMQGTGAELFVDLRLFRLVQMTICFRYNLPRAIEQSPAPATMPFQFLVTRFELLN